MTIDKNQVMRQFDRSAKRYDDVAGMQREIIDHLSFELPSMQLNTDSLICDLGCGTGYGLSILSQRYPDTRLIGVDLSTKMLQAVSGLEIPKLEVLPGDIEALPFAPSSVDICFSSSAVQWCDANLAFGQIYRALKPGGSALISSFLSGTLDSWRAMWGGVNQQSFLTLAETEKALATSGLSIEKIWCEPFIQSFSSFNAALYSVRGLGAGNASQDRAKGLMGRNHLRKVIERADKVIQCSGSIALNYEVVYIKASKLA